MKINENKFLRFLSWVFIGAGLFTIILFILIAPFNDWSWQTDSSLFSDYGEFIGGFVGALFSLAGFFLIYLTLIAQQKSIKKQEEEIRNQKKISDAASFEKTFFNLLNVHQNITNDLKATFFELSDIYTIRSYTVSGRELFSVAVSERFWINRSLSYEKFIGIFDLSDDEYVASELQRIENQGRTEPPDSNYYEEESGKLKRIRRLQLINKVYGITEEKWKEGHKTKGVDRVKFIYDLFFEKYHYVVGHYFRHLYHIIKFVSKYEEAQIKKAIDDNERSGIDDNERSDIKNRCRQYARFIQAQMSSYELALLHDNSLCFDKMLALVKKYHLLDNCSSEGLIYQTNYIER
jgi:hypothetical protein